jgi:hypothetical protein
MDLNRIDGFKKDRKNKYSYEKKRPDTFTKQLINDIKHNGVGYVRSYSTLQEILKIENKFSYVWDSTDNLYIVRYR